MTQLEICIDSVESAIAAQQGGAQRVELCSALTEGGLTPSIGLHRAVRSAIDIGLYVMIRPRGGDFLYSTEELAVMREDIAQARANGADGVVFGLLDEEGDVDIPRTRELVELASPMDVTFHRAVDMARDLNTAVEGILKTGANRILTSGAAQTALLGIAPLQQMIQTHGSRIQIMVCGGVRAENVGEIMRSTGARQFHAALRQEIGSRVKHRPDSLHLGATKADDYTRKVVMSQDVRSLRAAIDSNEDTNSRA